MLIEMTGDVWVDKTPRFRNFRLNAKPKEKKFRCKIEISDHSEWIPFDLIVQNYSFKLNGLNGIKIETYGFENNSKTYFNLNITFEILKKKFKFEGSIGDVNVDEKIASFDNFTTFISNVKKQIKTK